MDTVFGLFQIPFVVLFGALICAVAHFGAFKKLENVLQLVLLSALAEAGAALVGFGTGTFSGATGGMLHLFYQLSMRGLALVALFALYRRAGTFSLDGLRGIFRASPFMAATFGFAMFASLGFSPFKGAVSKFAVLHGAIASGNMLSAVLVLAGSVIALIYTLKVVQAVCFEKAGDWEPADVSRLPSVTVLGFAAGFLGALVVFVSVFPESLIHSAEHLVAGTFGIEGHLPNFESPWPIAAAIPYVGGFLVLLFGWLAPGRVQTGRFSVAQIRDVTGIVLAALPVLILALDGGLNPLARFFGGIMAFICTLVAVYSVGYMENTKHLNRYWFFLLLMEGSLVGLTTAGDLGSMYAFWELMTFTSYFLVIHGQKDEALSAGFKYFFMCASGAYAMLFGLLFLHVKAGSFEIAALAQMSGDIAPVAAAAIMVAFFVGFAVKAGLFPVHSWLPEAHPVAPSSISAPLSGILTKTGIFGFVLVGFTIFGAQAFTGAAEGAYPVGLLVSLVGAVTLIYAEIMALRQTNVKRMLAYSTMAQVGEITVTLGIGTYLSVAASLNHVLNHAIMKNLLFLAIGVIIMRVGSYAIKDLKGVGRAMPVTGGLFALGALAVMGLPPFNGFASKFMMVYACLQAGQNLMAAAILGGGLIGVVYYMRLVRVLFFEKYEGPVLKEASLWMLAPMGILGALAVFFGINPQAGLSVVAPVADMLVAGGKLAAQPLPDLGVTWPVFALVPLLGAIAPVVLRHDMQKAAWSAVGVLALSFVAVCASYAQVDTLSFCYALLVVMVAILNTVYSVNYMDHSHTQWRYFAFMLAMVGGLLGVAGASNLFSFFLFWEIMSSWTLYFVIIHEETASALTEGFKYFLFNVLGATFMFFGLVLLCSSAGSFEFGVLSRALGEMPGGIGAASLGFIALGFAMKAAMLPVRIDIWMHPATAPTPVSGYISSVLLKSGPFGLMKLFFVLGGAGFFAGKSGYWSQPEIMYALAWVAGITIVFAAAMAALQHGIKRMLIYSTVSQMGYILLGICAGTSLTVAGGALHFVNHMLFKNLAFLAAGAIMYRTHADSLNELSGIGRKMPVTLSVFTIAAFSAIGVPPFNGFTSKWMLYQGLMGDGEILLALLSLAGSVITMAYFIKFLHCAFFGQPSAKVAKVEEVGTLMRVPMTILAFGCVFFGVFPGMLLAPINSIIGQMGFAPLDVAISGVTTGAGAWNATATGLLMLAAYGFGKLILSFMSKNERYSDIHTCGVNDLGPEQLTVNADQLYEPAITVLKQWLAVPASIIANRRG